MKANFLKAAFLLVALIIAGCHDDGGPAKTTISQEIIASATGADLTGVALLNPMTGFISGDSGTVLKTTDGGQTWMKTDAGTKLFLSCVSVNNHDIYIGGSGIILKSTDEGITWKSSNVTGGINDIKINSKGYGYAIGSAWGFNSIMSMVYKTTDNGNSWEKITTKNDPVMLGLMISLIFINDSVLLMSSARCMDLGPCDALIFKGNINTDITRIVSNYGVSGATELTSFDKAHIFGSGLQGNIFYSPDAGETWRKDSLPTNNDLLSIAALSLNMYFACGDSGKIVYTSNMGSSWQNLDKLTNNSLSAVTFSSSFLGIAVGSKGTIIKIYIVDNRKL